MGRKAGNCNLGEGTGLRRPLSKMRATSDAKGEEERMKALLMRLRNEEESGLPATELCTIPDVSIHMYDFPPLHT